MKFLLLIALTFSMMLGIAQESDAKITVSQKTKYFTVTGKTGKQIYAQIRRRAPAELRRKKWIAATFAKYNFKKVRFGVKGNRCVATKVNIHLNLTYHYPKWKNRRNSSKKLQKHWVSFEQGLVRHEKTHGGIFKEMLQVIEKELRKSKGAARGNCRKFVSDVERKIKSIEKRYQKKQDAFDHKENKSSSAISRIESIFVKTN